MSTLSSRREEASVTAVADLEAEGEKYSFLQRLIFKGIKLLAFSKLLLAP